MSGPYKKDQRILKIASDDALNTLLNDEPPSPPKDTRLPRAVGADISKRVNQFNEPPPSPPKHTRLPRTDSPLPELDTPHPLAEEHEENRRKLKEDGDYSSPPPSPQHPMDEAIRQNELHHAKVRALEDLSPRTKEGIYEHWIYEQWKAEQAARDRAQPPLDAGRWPTTPPAPPSVDEQLQAIRNICKDTGVFTEEQAKDTRKTLVALDRKMDLQHSNIVKQLARYEAKQREPREVGLSDDVHASLSPATFTAFARLHKAIAALTKELRAERAEDGLVAGWLRAWDLYLAKAWQGFRRNLPWHSEQPVMMPAIRKPGQPFTFRKPL